MTGTISEKKLLYQLYTKKDPEAFAALYDLYIKRIYRFVYFKVSSHEEAEDVTSDVFLKAWNYLQEHSEVKSFSGLLYRIARNSIIDLYRAKAAKPEARLNEEFEVSDGGSWYVDVNDRVEVQRVLAALNKLKQEYKEVITLKYIDELDIDEIVEITGKGKIAIRVTLHRALKKLKDLL